MPFSPRTVLVTTAMASLFGAGCGNLKRSSLGGPCEHAYDCESHLSCSFGYCHATCFETRDCPSGQSCIRAPHGPVCQLPAEALCDATASCAGGFVCAVDNRCRAACSSAGDCTFGQKCTAGICMDPALPDAGSTDANPVDRPASFAGLDAEGMDMGGQGGGGAPGTGGTLGTGKAKFVGNIDTSRSIRPDFASYWNQFTPENAGKWGSVQRSGQEAFNWTSLDAMYKYCTDNNIIFKQHNFIWGSQQPSWTSSLTPDTGPAAVQNWMTSFCQRYPGVQIIDVVNEPPPHTTPAYADAIGGGTGTTWDWIVNAFKWARQACPSAILVLNDFSNAEDASTAQRNIDIVKVIKAAGAPIDAVGCQMHDAVVSSSGTLKANIDLIARATGLPVYITEFDIDTADDAEQERVMRDEVTMFWNNDNIKGVTLWGYVVGHTWRSNTGLIQDDGTMRPAMTWLMSFLGR